MHTSVPIMHTSVPILCSYMCKESAYKCAYTMYICTSPKPIHASVLIQKPCQVSNMCMKFSLCVSMHASLRKCVCGLHANLYCVVCALNNSVIKILQFFKNNNR